MFSEELQRQLRPFDDDGNGGGGIAGCRPTIGRARLG
eukprot:CAMPEP_0206463828 /NCGR_PEP_ID=MMETSP0324_2-20121206/26846_1 /ASSEMBLY_ACC=CAM_ASM_000836 /TAXON_ID=2866 /ORGANISM="Crypthecodinium cohnii, Strain Seligo" /LENGTH=36 /DNA_ID= /DNA_START= /DNA_END= /DNA_ORIENTATION=